MFRRYCPADLDSLRELLGSGYGDAEITQGSYLRWQYEDNPAGPACAWVAEDQAAGDLAAQYAVIPVRLVVDGVERTGGLTVNLFTDRRYRGRGLFTGLAHAVFGTLPHRGIVLAYGFPNPPSFPAFVGRHGFRSLGLVPLLIKPLRIREAARRAFGPLLGSLVGVPATVCQPILWPSPRGAQASGYSVESLTDIGKEFDAFWLAQRLRHRAMVVRDASYLRWRYLACPTRTYHVLAARAAGRIVGYLIGRVVKILGIRSGVVVDLLVETNGLGSRAAHGLIESWEGRCRAEGIEVLATLMVSHAPEFRVLRASGYWRVPRFLMPQPTHVTVRECTSELPALGLRDWFVTFGDYDVM